MVALTKPAQTHKKQTKCFVSAVLKKTVLAHVFVLLDAQAINSAPEYLHAIKFLLVYLNNKTCIKSNAELAKEHVKADVRSHILVRTNSMKESEVC